MLKRIIIFLIRKKLKLKLYQRFRFRNQKTDNVYYFERDKLIKVPDGVLTKKEKSLVSLNWLIDDRCEIDIVERG